MKAHRSQAVEAAKKSSETVLSALGIHPKPGGHIPCPYLEHADSNASWRWEPRDGKAHCSCSHEDIVGVVQKVQGCEFSAAADWLAELFGIEETRQGGGVPYYLEPLNEQRSEIAPRRYLAARLGIDESEVVMPATIAAGHRALGYWHMPEGGEKPEKVGDFPACCFEMRSPAGRQHAHRIYVSDDYRGKARILSPGGEELDPKKLAARKKNGQSTSGMAVAWGDYERAENAIVAEGIETAAAVALAFHEELERGEVAVFAAISAGGVGNFQPWPGTRRVTVAADRDERGEEGSRAGERAARKLGARLHDTHEVAIALPGSPGTKADWLDTLLVEGRESVREGILAAEAYGYRQGDEGRSNEPESAKENLYPLPYIRGIWLEYSGGELCMAKPAKENEERQLVALSSPIAVPFRLRYLDHDEAYGLRVRVEGFDGKPREIDFRRGVLARSVNEVKEALYDAGLRPGMDRASEATILSILRTVSPAEEIAVVSRRGWHRDRQTGARFFVTPGGAVYGAERVELEAHERLEPFASKAGTLEGWQEAVRTAAEVENLPMWELAMLSAFAGPLVALTDSDTCGLNLSGLSSGGKTTAQKIATSAWSTPVAGDGLLQTFRVTENSVEALAQAASGTLLALDDAKNIEGKTVGALVYMLSGGRGKARLSQDSKLKKSYQWRTFCLFSDEESLESKIRGDGGQWTPGMAVRFVDIDVNGSNRAAHAEAKALEAGIRENYGHAGPRFVEELVRHGWHERVEELNRWIGNEVERLAGADADSARRRAARVFAFLSVSGALAHRWGIIPTDGAKAVLWGWNRFQGSGEAESLNPFEAGLTKVQTFVAANWGSRIRHCQSTAPNVGAAGWWYGTGNDVETIYLTTAALAEALGGTIGVSTFAKELDARGHLLKKRGNQLTYNHVPCVGRASVYVLDPRPFKTEPEAEASNETAEPIHEPFTMPDPVEPRAEPWVFAGGNWYLDFNSVQPEPHWLH